MRLSALVFLSFLFLTTHTYAQNNPYLLVLGNVQDGGAPHIGCNKSCCESRWKSPNPSLKVVSLGVVSPQSDQVFLFEATPDIGPQMRLLLTHKTQPSKVADGIFLTHAHIGHYTGLMFLGREALGASKAKVWAMPKMAEYLRTNGPWSQLVTNQNIDIHPLREDKVVELDSELNVTPFLVPHRDEYSETVGYRIEGPNKSVLFIPDIDKWHKWDQDIKKEIEQVDIALIDGAFYDAAEINHRDISEIPHPFISESMDLFDSMPVSERQKVVFIHLNHTNPALNANSEASKTILRKGYQIARFMDRIEL